MDEKMRAIIQKAQARASVPSPRARREIREAAGISQADVALALGVSIATVCRWESGDANPRNSRLAADYTELLGELQRISSE